MKNSKFLCFSYLLSTSTLCFSSTDPGASSDMIQRSSSHAEKSCQRSGLVILDSDDDDRADAAAVSSTKIPSSAATAAGDKKIPLEEARAMWQSGKITKKQEALLLDQGFLVHTTRGRLVWDEPVSNLPTGDEEITTEKADELALAIKDRKRRRLEDPDGFHQLVQTMKSKELAQCFEKFGAGIVFEHRRKPLHVERIKKFSGPFHGIKLRDDYAWLMDFYLMTGDKSLQTPHAGDIVAIFEKERDYALSHVTEDLTEWVSEGLERFRSTTKTSCPIRFGTYLYYSEHPEGKSHPIYKRLHIPTNCVDTILDENRKYKKYADEKDCLILNHDVDNNDRLMGYAIDTKGFGRYRLRFEDTTTGAKLADDIKNTNGEFLFDAASKSVIYIGLDDKRSSKHIYKHVFGTDQSADTLIFSEKNPASTLHMQISPDHKFAIIYAGDHTAHDVYLYPLMMEGAPPLTQIVSAEKDNLGNCHVSVLGNWIYTVGYPGKSEGELFRSPLDKPGAKDRTIIVPEKPGYHLLECHSYDNVIALTYLKNGQKTISLVRATDFTPLPDPIAYHENVYDINVEYTTPNDPFLRLHYHSPLTQPTILEYEFSTGVTRKRHQEVIPGFDPHNFTTEQIFVDGMNGSKIPVSLFYRKMDHATTRPLYVTADAAFGKNSTMTLNDYLGFLAYNNVVVALAHPRGGLECGRAWHEGGKGRLKINTFTDTISVIEALHARGISSPAKTVFEGEGAGGLIAGYIANNKPTLVGTIIMTTPRLDLLNGMLNPGTLATPGDVSEWGNPLVSKEDFDAIASYCPYQNVKKQVYPNIILTTHEKNRDALSSDALKMAQRIKDNRTDDALTILYEGHSHVFRLSMMTKFWELMSQKKK